MVGEDKAYDTADHVAMLPTQNVTPDVAQYNSDNPNSRQSAIDERTTRHDGYGMSQSCHAMAMHHQAKTTGDFAGFSADC